MWRTSGWCTSTTTAYRYFYLYGKTKLLPTARMVHSQNQTVQPYFYPTLFNHIAGTRGTKMFHHKKWLPLMALQNPTHFSLSWYSSLSDVTSSAGAVKEESADKESSVFNCNGCGAHLQASDPNSVGYIPQTKFEQLSLAHSESPEGDNTLQGDAQNQTWKDVSTSTVICQRCFSLLHYNTALKITLKSDDYLTHLHHLRDKRALILLMVDVIDFPASLFPELKTLIHPANPVMIVANKTDLLPKNLQPEFWKHFETMIVKECQRSSLAGCKISGVQFTSAKSGQGVTELTKSILTSWGNRGDIYLLGCTNVGKSTLFNKLLVTICGARPGEISMDSNIATPSATISQWPGTTLGLLRFPIMSMGKRRRLLAQDRRDVESDTATYTANDFLASDEQFREIVFDEDEALTPKEAKLLSQKMQHATEKKEILEELGLYRRREAQEHKLSPQNRFWLYDTPGAVNDTQLINLLTTSELKLALPKKSLKPRTFILKPGQSMFLGGLARLDYHSGPVSAYFTVFATPYLPIHTTKIEKADEVYARNIGTHLLKIPIGGSERLATFPALQSQELIIRGVSWKQSASDVVLSSAGWVSVMVGANMDIVLRAYTPGGKGIYCREPALLPDAVQERGKRSKKGNRTAFKGR